MNQKSKLTFGKIFERFSYGCGYFGCNIIYAAMSAFLLFYYTDYANVSAMAVGTIMMVSRIFDGVSDIIMGVIVDRTRSKYGKARPWILRMCIPFAVSGILLFSVPASWASTPKLVYVFITYNLVSTVIYTAINVPYSALNALMTQDPYERSVLSIFRNLLATAGTLTINTFTLPLVEYFGNNAAAWTKTFVVFGFVAIAAFLCTFFGTKERVRAAENEGEVQTEDVPFVTGIKALFKNKYWVIVTVASFVVFFVIIMYAMGNVYYCQYVLYDMGQYSWVSNSISIAQFAVMFVTPAFMKKFGKTAVYEAGMVVMGLGFLGFAVLGGSSTIVMIICNVLKGCGVGMAGGMALGMVADTITYGTKKTGIDTVGLGNAGVSAAQKIGLGLGTAVFGWVLNGAGYDGSLDAQGIAQPESVSTAINFLYNWLPFIMVIAIFVLMVILYHCERDLKKMEAAE